MVKFGLESRISGQEALRRLKVGLAATLRFGARCSLGQFSLTVPVHLVQVVALLRRRVEGRSDFGDFICADREIFRPFPLGSIVVSMTCNDAELSMRQTESHARTASL